MYMHYRWVTSILNGVTSGDVTVDGKTQRILYFSNNPFKFRIQTACELISTYHKGGNHWTFVHFNLSTFTLTYMDPKGNEPPMNLLLNWNTYWRRFCKEYLVGRPVGDFTIKQPPHSLQHSTDNNNCGIYTLGVCAKYIQTVCQFSIIIMYL